MWPHYLALSWLHPPWHWGWWALYVMSLCLLHVDVRAPGGPHTLLVHSRGHTTALPQLQRGNKISAVQKTLAFFGTRERNQMSNPVTPHSVKQWCGSIAVGRGAVLRPTGLMYPHPRKEASLPKEGHHSDALQPCDFRRWWKFHLSRQF